MGEYGWGEPDPMGDEVRWRHGVRLVLGLLFVLVLALIGVWIGDRDIRVLATGVAVFVSICICIGLAGLRQVHRRVSSGRAIRPGDPWSREGIDRSCEETDPFEVEAGFRASRNPGRRLRRSTGLIVAIMVVAAVVSRLLSAPPVLPVLIVASGIAALGYLLVRWSNEAGDSPG